MMRQIGKQILTIVAWLGLILAARADGLVSTVITDPLTGIAIDGYDPVSYFIEADPLPGKPDYEYDWAGVPWYFASAANRDIFMRNPEVYAPQFGGHCLMSLSRGYLSDGKPRLYVIDGLKLYFFYSTANRDAFLMSRHAAIEAADKNWPALARALSGPDAERQAASGLVAEGDEPDSGAPPGDAAAASEVPPASAAADAEPDAASSSEVISSQAVAADAASVAPASANANVQPN